MTYKRARGALEGFLRGKRSEDVTARGRGHCPEQCVADAKLGRAVRLLYQEWHGLLEYLHNGHDMALIAGREDAAAIYKSVADALEGDDNA